MLYRTCDKELELLSVCLSPFWLPREFNCIHVAAVYCPPSGNSERSASQLKDYMCRLDIKHPNSATIIGGDFNHVNVNIGKFKQFVTCTTRGSNTLDKVFCNIRNSYSSVQLCPLSFSDHNIILLNPRYFPLASKATPTPKLISIWSIENCDALSHDIEVADWNVLLDGVEDINEQTTIFTDYINFFVEN